MRRLLTVSAALILLTSTAACGSEDETPSGTGSSTAASSATTAAVDLADATKKACGEAVPLSEQSSTAFLTGFNKALEVAVEGSEADAEKALADLRAGLNSWSTKLTELAGQPIDEQAKAALAEGAAEIKALSSPDDNTPIAQVERTLKDVTDKIKAACA